MIIESKFECGQTAWYWDRDELIPVIIKRIVKYDSDGFFYEALYVDIPVEKPSIKHEIFLEKDLYRTPEDYINSLKEINYTEIMNDFLELVEELNNPKKKGDSMKK